MEEDIQGQLDGSSLSPRSTPKAPRRFSRIAILPVAIFCIGIAVLAVVGSHDAGTPSLLGTLSGAVRGAALNVASLFSDTFGSGRTIVFESSTGGTGSESISENGVFDEPTAMEISSERCSFASSGPLMSDRVVISEVAWMGSVESAQGEWVEIGNPSDTLAQISGWQLVDQDDQVHVTFASGTVLRPHGFLLLARKSVAASSGTADVIYTGSLRNSDEGLRLYDADCNLVDEALARPTWPAGENTTKRTMERDAGGAGWHTSQAPGGTPGKENSKPTATAITTIATTTGVSMRTTSTSTPTSTTSGETTSTKHSASDDEPALCAQDNLGAPSYGALVNEVAWAGTGSLTTSDEWIELKNPGVASISLAGWQLINKARTMHVVFDSDAAISPNGYFLLERTDDATVPTVPADVLYTGALKNNDESLRLFDERCGRSHVALVCIHAGRNDLRYAQGDEFGTDTAADRIRGEWRIGWRFGSGIEPTSCRYNDYSHANNNDDKRGTVPRERGHGRGGGKLHERIR